MKIQIKNLNKTKKKLSIDLEAKNIDEAYQTAYNHVRKNAKIKGFRNGKVPNQVLDQFYGHQVKHEALDAALQKAYSQALTENNLYPVLQPKFDFKFEEFNKNTDFSFTVEMEVAPEIELKDYKEIKLKKRETKIEQKEIDDELKRLQESKANLKPADEKATLQKGLVAVMDFEGTIDGKPFQGGKAQGYSYEHGAGRMLPDFEKNIEGMKMNEEKTIDVNFPTDYASEDLKGKTAQFKIKINSLHEKDLPVLDDELAKDFGKNNLDEIKKEIEEMIKRQKEAAFRNEYAKEAIEHLIKKHKVDVPEGLLKIEVEEHKKEKDEAEKTIKTQFILEAIAKAENIKPERQDVEMKIRQLAMMYRQPIQVIQDHYVKNNMMGQLLSQIVMEKTLDFVIDNATMS